MLVIAENRLFEAWAAQVSALHVARPEDADVVSLTEFPGFWGLSGRAAVVH